VRLPYPRLREILRIIGGGACALGAVGGITGMLAGALAPGILTGLYALDGPAPPATFSPVIWGSQQGFLIGLSLGAGGTMLAWSCHCVASWKPQMTTRQWMIAVVVLAVCLTVWRAWWTPAGFGRGYVCSLCRLHRGDTKIHGVTRSVHHATDFSGWYSSYIEPHHEHLWEPESNIANYNFLGYTIGGGTGASRKIPIHLLSASQHQRFLEHVTNIGALKTLFASVITKQSDEDDGMEEGYAIIQAIMDWEAIGYRGTWDDWWARHWKGRKQTQSRDSSPVMARQ
jgi:hypothetical protein